MNPSLMEAVLAGADGDDDARLVYADWCEEEGELDRATFIRVQIERTRRSEWDVEQIGLQVQEEKLMREHGEAWLAEIEPTPGIKWTGFERGFPARAEAESFGALVDARDAIVAALPLQHVLVPWPEDEARARSATSIPTLRGLRIERAVLDREPYWLADSPLLSTVTDLAIVDGYTDDPGTTALLASLHLRGLQKLAMIRNEIGTQGVPALVDAEFPELSHLALEERGGEDSWSQWEGGLELAAMEAFAGWAGLERLRRLDLSGNRIPAMGFEALLHSPHLTGLDALRLESVFTQADEIPWGGAPTVLRIQDLCLAHHYLTENVDPITQAPCLSELRRLDLRGAQFDASAHVAPILAGFSSTLEELDVQGLDVVAEDDEGGAHAWLTRANFPRLHTLRVGNTYNRPDNDDELIAWADTQHLRSLRLEGNVMRKAAEALASASFPNLERLEIRGMHKTQQAVLANSALGKRLLDTGGLLFVV